VTQAQNKHITVSIAEQRLQLWQGDDCVFEARVATASNGPGEQFGSECTPRGAHVIRARIGGGCIENTVFVGRRPTGEIYSPALLADYPERDWILTRILWLSGTEPGRNRLGEVDTMRRYVYIHGCPDEVPMGIPSSHGCIKMRNADVIALFDLVDVGTPVIISEA
jgi:lipoprotein-anchoring transpeptidase ErfK/SrfK